ncbi:MAG TPA: SMC-Scp complex subunit ScpB [Thermoleophilia bacterium]|nr:SMC-Scp complex subunit ScpB [Thermoleophilia bacterium]
MNEAARLLEAVLFISPRPVTREDLAAACGLQESGVEEALDELRREYDQRHGLEVRDVAGGVTFAVARECEAAVERFAGARRPDDLSPALLEALSVVAYLQPATRAEVARVRGVSSDWALATLEERGLVAEAGRADSPGSPILYRTTERFLQLFGLRDLAGLPPLGEFELTAADVDEIRSRLLANAERRGV